MVSRSRTFVAAGIFLGGLAALTNYAFAQQRAPSVNEQVVVMAPYVTHEVQKTLGVTGSADRARGVYEVHTLTSNVTYADLDLSKPSDAIAFEKRISDAANMTCNQLKTLYPDPPYAEVRSADCAKTAAGEAMVVASLLIDASKINK